MQNVTEEVVKFSIKTNFDDLPKDAVHEAKRVFLDSIGCALDGLDVAKGKISVQLARLLGASSESTILGTGDKVSSAAAAYANGELVNATDMDSLLFPAHVSPYVIPAPLALGESRHASGKDLIAAIVLGHEISTRLGKALMGPRFDKEGNYIPDETAGFSSAIIGGAIGAAKILDLDESRMLQAVGIAGHRTPVPAEVKWRMTAPSGMDKYVSAGWTSMAEVVAALLAEMGYAGDKSVLDGDYGFWKFYCAATWHPERISEKLGSEWQFLATSYKPYPNCRLIHAAMDAFNEIMEENQLKPEDIEKVTALVTPHLDALVWQNRQINSHVDAQFSVPFAFSLLAYRIPITDWQTPETCKDQKLLDFMQRVNYETHPDFGKMWLNNPQNQLSSVEVVAGGQSFKKEKLCAKGDYFSEEARMTDEELEAKFRMNASRTLRQENIDNAVRAIFEMDKISDISALLPVLCS
jgi:2-methylcitrate dehydratase PrpD